MHFTLQYIYRYRLLIFCLQLFAQYHDLFFIVYMYIFLVRK